jgi:hypothetical protein
MIVGPSITNRDVSVALRGYLLSLFPDSQVFQSQENFVPEPNSDFILMTDSMVSRLATNSTTGTVDSETQTARLEIVMQLDIYGQNGADHAAVIVATMRGDYAYANFPDDVKPLYATDPVQIPIINAEGNFEQRWSIDIHMQYNPEFTAEQETTSTASINQLIAADVIYQ